MQQEKKKGHFQLRLQVLKNGSGCEKYREGLDQGEIRMEGLDQGEIRTEGLDQGEISTEGFNQGAVR